MQVSQLLQVDLREKNSGTWIVLGGEMDLDSASVFTDASAAALGTGARALPVALHVDLSALTFCDCGGLGALLRAARDTRTQGGTFRAHAPAPAVLRLLTLTGTAGVLLGDQSRTSGQLDHDEAA